MQQTFWDKSRNKWQTRVAVLGKTHYAGRYDTLSEAVRAVLRLRAELHTNNLTDHPEKEKK